MTPTERIREALERRDMPVKRPVVAPERRSAQPATDTAPKRKRAKGSPTTRSMDVLKERGYLADIVERRLTRKLTKDWLGIADIIAVREEREMVAVQTTSDSNVAARVKKITASPHLETLRRWGIRIVVHGWRRSQRKATKGQWVLREVDLS